MSELDVAPPGRLLHTADGAAEILSTSRATVYRLKDAGDLDAVKIGRSMRITHESIERLVDRLRTERHVPTGGASAA